MRGASLFAGRWWQLLALLATVVAVSAGLHAVVRAAPAVPAARAVLLAGAALLAVAYAVIAWRVLLAADDRAALRAALVRRR